MVTSITLLIVFIVAWPVLAIVTAARRRRDMTALAERGQLTQGRVVARRPRPVNPRIGRIRRLQVSYEHPAVGTQRRWFSVSPDEWTSLQRDALVDVIYLADNPHVFTLRSKLPSAG